MKRLIFLSILVFRAVWIFCQEENADAIYEKLYREYTLETNGSIVYREYKQLKLLSYLSFNRLYGETFIVFNKDYQQLKINDSYTIMADGKKVYTPENAFNEVLLREAHLSPVANNLREMVVTHTALERNATIVLDYTLTSSPEFSPALMGNLLLQESSPIKELKVTIKVPAGTKLQYKTTGIRTAPEISVDGLFNVFTWTISNIPPLPKETMMGKYPPLSPRLIFTSADSFSQLFSWITSQPAFDFSASSDIQQFVDSIRKNHTEELKVLISLQKEVARNIAHESYLPYWIAYRCRTPEEIFLSNGGNRLEKTVLLTTFLRAANFTAEPVITAPESLFDKKEPNLAIFDGFFVRVNTKSHGTLYLSATETELTNFEYALANHIGVKLVKKPDEDFYFIKPQKNSIRLEGQLKPDQQLKTFGEAHLHLSGAVNPFLTAQEDKNSLKSILSGNLIPSGEAIIVKNSNLYRSEIHLNISASESLKEENGYIRWILPVVTNGFERWKINFLPTERLSALVLPSTLEERYQWTISIPEGYELVNQSFSGKLHSAAGTVVIEIKPGKRQVEINRELIIEENIINPEDYQKFREMINFWLDRNLRTVVLKPVS